MQTTFEKMGGTYRQEGDYLLPNFELPQNPNIGIWGERRRRYLREHQKAFYAAMMLNDTLNAHLEEVDHIATEMYNPLTSQLADQESTTAQLKEGKQMEWGR